MRFCELVSHGREVEERATRSRGLRGLADEAAIAKTGAIVAARAAPAESNTTPVGKELAAVLALMCHKKRFFSCEFFKKNKRHSICVLGKKRD